MIYKHKHKRHKLIVNKFHFPPLRKALKKATT